MSNHTQADHAILNISTAFGAVLATLIEWIQSHHASDTAISAAISTLTAFLVGKALQRLWPANKTMPTHENEEAKQDDPARPL